MMYDELISRQAAIEIVERYNKSHMVLKQQPMLGAASIVIELEELPSVQLGTNLVTRRTVKGFPIDADLLMQKAEEIYGDRARDRLYEIIRYMSKYELPERKKGAWTKDASCQFCGFKPWYERDIHTLSFCPNCGADMRGKQDE